MPNSSYKHNIPVPRSHPDYMTYYKQLKEDRLKEIARDWSTNNKEKKQAQWREWYKRNKDKQKIKVMLEKHERLQRMPSWVDQDELIKIYENRPDGYYVDHIVPLRGKNVSGLHVPWNLQYLPAQENMSKGNKFD